MTGDALSQDPAGPRRRTDSGKARPARVHDVFLGGEGHSPADLEDPATVLERAAGRRDFERPIALCPAPVPHFVEDGEAYPIVCERVDALPSGSRVVLSHLTEDLDRPHRGKPRVGGTRFPRLRTRAVTAAEGAVP